MLQLNPLVILNKNRRIKIGIFLFSVKQHSQDNFFSKGVPLVLGEIDLFLKFLSSKVVSLINRSLDIKKHFTILAKNTHWWVGVGVGVRVQSRTLQSQGVS